MISTPERLSGAPTRHLKVPDTSNQWKARLKWRTSLASQAFPEWPSCHLLRTKWLAALKASFTSRPRLFHHAHRGPHLLLWQPAHVSCGHPPYQKGSAGLRTPRHSRQQARQNQAKSLSTPVLASARHREDDSEASAPSSGSVKIMPQRPHCQ